MGKASPVFSTNTNTLGISDDSQGVSTGDFVILCPSANGWGEAASALQYLPANYKLTIISDAIGSELGAFAQDRAIMDRIQVEKQTSLSDAASPFVFADAVVYSDADQVASESTTPRVVISKGAGSNLKNSAYNEFVVSADSPEAFASAVLRIAKAA